MRKKKILKELSSVIKEAAEMGFDADELFLEVKKGG